MNTFVSKPPFNLADFLSKPGSPKKARIGRCGNANFRPRPKPDEDQAPVEEAPEA